MTQQPFDAFATRSGVDEDDGPVNKVKRLALANPKKTYAAPSKTEKEKLWAAMLTLADSARLDELVHDPDNDIRHRTEIIREALSLWEEKYCLSDKHGRLKMDSQYALSEAVEARRRVAEAELEVTTHRARMVEIENAATNLREASDDRHETRLVTLLQRYLAVRETYEDSYYVEKMNAAIGHYVSYLPKGWDQ